MIIAQYHGVSKLSRLIQWQSRSEISHTAIILGDEARLAHAAGRMPDWLQECKIYEAWGTVIPPRGQVYLRTGISDGHTQGTRIDLYIVDCPNGRHEAVRRFLDGQVGAKYDYRALLSFLTRRDRHRQGAWICSELAFVACELFGVRLLERIEPYAVSPALINISPRLVPFGTTWARRTPVFVSADDSRTSREPFAAPSRITA